MFSGYEKPSASGIGGSNTSADAFVLNCADRDLLLVSYAYMIYMCTVRSCTIRSRTMGRRIMRDCVTL